MPIYDYQCASCGHKAEVMRKISAASTEACPACGAETFSKQLSAPSFQLTGSGWYATDFKNGNTKTAASTGKADASAQSASTPATSAAPNSDTATTAAPCATGCACH